jgi:hypothetical protein
MEEKTYTLTPELKKQIDGMCRAEMCRIWRFAITGEPQNWGGNENR